MGFVGSNKTAAPMAPWFAKVFLELEYFMLAFTPR
jgi:hypothetical protein